MPPHGHAKLPPQGFAVHREPVQISRVQGKASGVDLLPHPEGGQLVHFPGLQGYAQGDVIA